jgi:hypothetical protein
MDRKSEPVWFGDQNMNQPLFMEEHCSHYMKSAVRQLQKRFLSLSTSPLRDQMACLFLKARSRRRGSRMPHRPVYDRPPESKAESSSMDQH